jgi:glycosyltransferase involved in cell wall biosynthesis
MSGKSEYSIFDISKVPYHEISAPDLLVDNPLVSVKMITYNQKSYIARAIEKVLQQETEFLFELVIGEDCSTDGTREIVLDYQKKHPDIIRIITSDKNVGLRKNGLRTDLACRGKYIAYCEGDDYWHHPKKLQMQVEYLENHPEYGFVFSDFDCFYEADNKIIRNYRKYRGAINNIPEDKKEALVDLLYGKLCILTCTVCARKCLSDRLTSSDPYLYESDHFSMGDIQRWAGLSQLSTFGYVDISLATHNVLKESASQSRDVIKKSRFSRSNAELCLYLAEKYNLPEKYCEAFRMHYWRKGLRVAFYEKDARLAEEAEFHIKDLTLWESMLYYGARNKVVNFVVRPAIILRNKIKKKYTSKYHL